MNLTPSDLEELHFSEISDRSLEVYTKLVKEVNDFETKLLWKLNALHLTKCISYHEAGLEIPLQWGFFKHKFFPILLFPLDIGLQYILGMVKI